MFLAATVHPSVIYPLTLRFLMRRRPAPALAPPDAPRPSLAICVCAYNEADVIVDKVETLLAMAAEYGPATVHVYADAPADDTVALLTPYRERIDLVVGGERRGKTFGMNTLVARTQADLLMFTDANVQSDIDAAAELVRPFVDPTIGMVTAQLIYSNPGETPTSTLGALYWSKEESIKRLESVTVGLVGCDGAMFVLRRSIHQPPPPHLIDDLYLSLRVMITGYRVVSLDHVRVFERSATGNVEEKRRKQRIACQAINVHRALWGQLRRMRPALLYAYLSHRVLKWMIPFSLAGASACLLAAAALVLPAVVVVPGVLALAALLYVADRLHIPPLSFAASAVLSLWGVAAGVMESFLLNKTYAVWEPAQSVRSPSGSDGGGDGADATAEISRAGR